EIDKLLDYLKPNETQALEIRQLSQIPDTEVPRRVVEEKEFAGRLPIFFCSFDDDGEHVCSHQPFTEEQLDGVLDMIKESMLQ
ncbi:hypothetical protein ACKI16_46915, partial [Streptomyces scabiei]|uniref:hypothetical protein n=1 Tax=Streptomyces scabiei TaxID=1930 RepID=UPI0038F6D3CF